jgi:type VI secretion system secreted protein VgrG
MPSPKSGNAGSAVSPADPTAATDADNAVAGTVDQTSSTASSQQPGQQKSIQVAQTKPYKSDPTKKSWIEIVMVDESNNPVTGEEYSITLPDGTVATGTLDDKGFARVDGIDSGNCQISFTALDQDAWEKA